MVQTNKAQKQPPETKLTSGNLDDSCDLIRCHSKQLTVKNLK